MELKKPFIVILYKERWRNQNDTPKLILLTGYINITFQQLAKMVYNKLHGINQTETAPAIAAIMHG
jgi:hypothetical protein